MKATLIFLTPSAKAETLCQLFATHMNHEHGEGYVGLTYGVDADTGAARAVFDFPELSDPDDEDGDEIADVLSMNSALWGTSLGCEVWLDNIHA